MALFDPDLCRYWLLRLGFPLAAFPLARRRSNARPGALSHPQLLRLDRPLILRRCRCRSPDRRAVSHHALAGLVGVLGRQSDRPQIAAQWPLSADKNAAPGSVVGEVHHPVKTVEIRNPSWLIIPERGFYTGVAIFGAVESGKTSVCMHPLAQQILSRQAANPQRRAGLPQLSEGRRTIPGRDGDFRGSGHRGALVSAPNDSATPRWVPKMGDHQPALSRSPSR